MARHLTTRDVDAIVNLIHGWSGAKLTWEAICDAAEPLVGKRPSRQSLNAHGAIVNAYKVVKKGGRQIDPMPSRPSSLKTAAARISKLERERDQLREENRAYKQKFVLWQYNAYKHGLKEHQLDEPLPKIDRERSDGSAR
ncbi:MAG: hypothetical protein JJU06_19185 [Ectothiorhodospiraceae bacterium]|nr:hypothetical protein [Ectothiorhodospiraceae bacterium]